MAHSAVRPVHNRAATHATANPISIRISDLGIEHARAGYLGMFLKVKLWGRCAACESPWLMATETACYPLSPVRMLVALLEMRLDAAALSPLMLNA